MSEGLGSAVPPEGAVAWLHGLLRDEAFMSFVQEEPYRYRTANEYQCLDLPPGIDGELARELVSFARRMRGMPLLSAEEPSGPHPYWVVSPAMYGTVCDLAVRSGVTSNLNTALGRLGTRAELRRFIVRDLDAALRRDGAKVELEVLDTLVAKRREPRDACELLVANAAAVMGDADVDSFARNDGPAWLESLYKRLLKGAENLQDHPRERVPAAEIIGIPNTAPQSLDRLWARILRAGHLEVHPLMDVVFVCDVMFDERPFERFNGLVEVVLRHVLLRALNLPALRFVPYSALRLDWEMGINPQDHEVPYGKAALVEPYGVDSTLALRESIGCFSRGLSELESAVRAIEEHDAERRTVILADWRLNQRQKKLLCELVTNPGQSVDALSYERLFDIAQSTAHTDLAALVRMGLLTSDFQGRKQVFRLREEGLGR